MPIDETTHLLAIVRAIEKRYASLSMTVAIFGGTPRQLEQQAFYYEQRRLWRKMLREVTQ